MAKTNVRGTQVTDGTIQRTDLDVTTVGQAVVAKVLPGTNMTGVSTGGDAGTGDVTLSPDFTSLRWKDPVLCVATTNLTLSGEQTIDGQTTSASRVLRTWQTSAQDNGIYVTAAGAWTRSVDANANTELVGATVPVTKGTLFLGTAWILKAPGIGDTFTLGTTAQTWVNVGRATDLGTGSLITVFGHSYVTGGGVSKPAQQYITEAAGLLRTDLEDLGVGASSITNDEWWLADSSAASAGGNNGHGGWAWILQSMQVQRTAAPDAPQPGLPWLHYGSNDMQQHAHDATGAPLTIFHNSLRTALSALFASRDFQDTSSTIVYAGATAWQNRVLDTYRNSGSGYRALPANADTFTITIPADFAGGTIAVRIPVWPASDGQINWTGTFSESGAAATTLSAKAYAAGNTGLRRNSSNCVTTRFTNLPASDATKTIIGTYASGAGTQFATPAQQGALTVNGTVGIVTYGYKRVYRTYNGDTIPSTERTVATGNATLTGTNSITIPAGGTWPSGVVLELIIRTTGGTNNGNQGIIGALTAPAAFTDVGIFPTTYPANTVNPLTGGAALDGWHIEANNPSPRAVVVKLNRLLPGSYINSCSDTDVTNYNAEIDSVVAEFPSGTILAIDADTVLQANAALFAADGVHPNDLGHGALAGYSAALVRIWGSQRAQQDQGLGAQAMKRITARRLNINKPFRSHGTGLQNVFGLDAIGESEHPMNSTIAAVNLPFNGTGTADLTLDSTVRVLDLTNLAGLMSAEVGDDLVVEFDGQVNATAQTVFMDVAFLTAAGAVIRYWSANTNNPTVFPALGGPINVSNAVGTITQCSGRVKTTVQLGDLITIFGVAGQVWAALVGKVNANSRILFGGGASTNPGSAFEVINRGRRNNTFNTS